MDPDIVWVYPAVVWLHLQKDQFYFNMSLLNNIGPGSYNQDCIEFPEEERQEKFLIFHGK